MESPSWLLQQGRLEDALQARNLLGLADDPSYTADNAHASDKFTFSQYAGKIRRFFTDPGVIRACLSVAILRIVMALSGLPNIQIYTMDILLQTGMKPEIAGGVSVGINTIPVLGGLVGIAFIQRCGRRIAYFTSAVGMIVCLLVFVILGVWGELSGIMYARIVPLVAFGFFASAGVYPVTVGLPAEWIPIEYRSICLGVLLAMEMIVAFLSGFVFPPILLAIGQYVFLVHAGVLALATLYGYLRIIEVKDKTENEIYEMFSSRKHWV